jgi:uncharacterized flavoprotein (TIGR03862 family)
VSDRPPVVVIGGGPAGLMAATELVRIGHPVELYDAMPSVGRKFLLAGRGGLNLTHSEPPERFVTRYGAAAARATAWLDAFGPDDARSFAASLGIETFVGSSGRVFPKDFKAAPLLRAWVARLRGQGVRFHARQLWTGIDADGSLRFGATSARASAAILALGGASWPHLGSDGGWVPILQALGGAVAPLAPSNCGFEVGWSPGFLARMEGKPLKRIALSFSDRQQRGELTVTRYGLEGGALYALSGPLRDTIARDGRALLELDLKPDLTAGDVAAKLARRPPKQSLPTHLKKVLGIEYALIREAGVPLPAAVKALPITVTGVRPIAEAISTAGGVALDAVTDELMLRARPGLFVAGEMLDWDAPTGGYLLQAAMATGVVAARGAARFLGDASGSA